MSMPISIQHLCLGSWNTKAKQPHYVLYSCTHYLWCGGVNDQLVCHILRHTWQNRWNYHRLSWTSWLTHSRQVTGKVFTCQQPQIGHRAKKVCRPKTDILTTEPRRQPRSMNREITMTKTTIAYRSVAQTAHTAQRKILPTWNRWHPSVWIRNPWRPTLYATVRIHWSRPDRHRCPRNTAVRLTPPAASAHHTKNTAIDIV